MTNHASASDTNLLQLCLAGDHYAYGKIVERYQSQICAITYSVCGDLGQSEDLAQETFVTAWAKLTELQDLAKFKAWLCTIARNLAKRSLRKKSGQLHRQASELDSALDAVDCADSPRQQTIRDEEAALVWETLAQIPETYREPMILFYREEHSIARVADAMDLSEDAVKQRLSRGRKMLHTQLATLIESTLFSTRPTTAFTATVVGSVAALAPSAKAAGAAVAATKVVAGAGLSFAVGMILLKLPLSAWALKLQLDNTRDEEERRWTLQLVGRLAVLLLVYGAALLSIPLWSHLLPPVSNPFLPAGCMVLVTLPIILLCRHYGLRVQRHRTQEEAEVEDGVALTPRRMYAHCLGGILLVLAWPGVFFAVHGTLDALAILLALIVFVPLVATGLHRVFAAGYFQLFGVNLAVPGLIAIALLWSRREVHSAVTELPWDLIMVNGMVTTLVVLMLVVWKRVYGQVRTRNHAK